MNLYKFEYWPGLVLAFFALVFTVFFLEKRFYKIVRQYWFYKRSTFSYISTLLFIAGMEVLLLSLLDLRGPEERIKAQVPTERTIILVDTSASMLAEDVKPNRLQKAALIAKHFARKAAGHQISVVAFAEIQKKIVPFTNDLDLIDARLDSIKSLKNHYGSSALTLAIQESIQYFKEAGDLKGNILVLTDGEETSEGVKLDIPKEIHVAFVGIGTSQGGRIPLEESQGIRFGYKKHDGKDVITKLNENFFRKTANDLPSGKYWLANSYSLPSDEIVDFFKSEMIKGGNEQDMVIRPVMMEWVVLPALALLILSYFFKALRVFTLSIFLVVLPLHAQESEAEVPEALVQELSRLQAGKMSKVEKVKLADDLYQAGVKSQALELYEENLQSDKIDPSIPPEAYLNYGTALLDKGDISKALSTYQNLDKSLPQGKKKDEIKDIMNKNSLSYFRQQEKKKKEEKEKKDKNKDNKDKKEGEDKKDGESGQPKDQQGDSKSQQNSPDGKDQKDKKDGNSDEQKKEQEKKDQEEKDKENKDKSDKEDKDKKENQPEEGEPKKPLPPRKMPAKLKQLMSDDRQIQMKVIENGTRDLNKRRSRNSKDW